MDHTKYTVHDRLEGDDERIEASPRSFGLVFAVVFAVYGGVAPLIRHQAIHGWALVLSALLLLLAAAAPRVLNPATRLWQRVGLVLHSIVNPVVMAVLFYLAVTPFGVLMRTFGRGWADRFDIDHDATTYWVTRDAARSPPMTRQF